MIYFDSSATTIIKKEVRDYVNENIIKNFGNPSSLHRLGIDAEKIVNKTKGTISKIINCSYKEIYFTSGGTEANNIAIIGSAKRNIKKGKHIITSSIEHSSVISSCKYLESIGYDITYLNPDKHGFIDFKLVKEALRDDTILVSIMHINNEVGTIQNIKNIGELVKKSKNAYFHVDAVQSYGKIPIDVKAYNIDMLSISAHKIHGYKGIGALYVKKDILIEPLFYGGHQEKGLRPGTENMPGILSLYKASEIISEEMDVNYKNARKIKNIIINGLENNKDIKINSSEKNGNYSPYILSISFKNFKGEVMLHTLEQNKLFVSTGSACNSKKKQYSHVLKAMEVDEEFIDGTIRLSFSSLNTEEEAQQSLKIIDRSIELLNMLMSGR